MACFFHFFPFFASLYIFTIANLNAKTWHTDTHAQSHTYTHFCKQKKKHSKSHIYSHLSSINYFHDFFTLFNTAQHKTTLPHTPQQTSIHTYTPTKHNKKKNIKKTNQNDSIHKPPLTPQGHFQ